MLTRVIAVCTPDPAIRSKYHRRREMLETVLLPQLRHAGLNPEIFPAIISAHLKPENGYLEHRGLRIQLGEGCPGNLLSNYELWRLSAEQNQPVLILEDDALLPPERAPLVVAALREFLTWTEPNDLLYLLSESPSIKGAMRNYTAADAIPRGQYLSRLIRTGDLSCTAAYCVKPAAARVLMSRIDKAPTRPTDGYVHTAQMEGAINVAVLQRSADAFLLNEVWAPWNHLPT